jgi:hypothetical protein
MGIGKKIFGENNAKIRGGSWYGNDTLWRMILDINKALFYANSDGSLKENSIAFQKNYISIVDAIIAGEGNGPKSADKIKPGYLIAGVNPVSVDTVCACLMNFNFRKIPSIDRAFKIKNFPLVNFQPENIHIQYEGITYGLKDFPRESIVSFKAPNGWTGRIEK